MSARLHNTMGDDMSGEVKPNVPANRLRLETSPYLLQHANNPVDWYAWSEEALQAAQLQDKPIFLSIGYSACHWCHVMEHESFENPDIAALMNRYFINIKVDREERPDLDQIYMSAVQLLTRHGGWPMSVFLTPDLRPFYGGTYFPPMPQRGMPGFGQILEQIHQAWTQRRDEVTRGADELTDAIMQVARSEGDRSTLNDTMLRQATQTLISHTDRTHGGFGQAPKFPHAMDLRVLLRGWKRFGDGDALAMARLTLDRMAMGGIYDHLGGGFHRYSTDARWLVPHFEKMLYDNALLTPAYLEAYQATRDPLYAQTARETLDYVLREMTSTEGGFFSTQDADSEGEEGKFFVWTEDEIIDLLGPADASLFCDCYDVTESGNWEGHSILNRPKTLGQAARLRGLTEQSLAEVLDRSRAKLFAARQQRVAPGRDEKVLTGWNGMMISAFALGAQILGDEKYVAAARSAADFILSRMLDKGGRLLHSYKDGQARFNGYLDDYACLIDGLTDLYQACFEPRYLERAVDLAERMIARFHDAKQGGFFYTSTDHEQLIARNKEAYDGSTPSGNSMAATALLRLGRLRGRRDFEDLAVSTLEFLSPVLAQSPTAAGQALLALDFLLGPTREIVLVEGTDSADLQAVLQSLHGRFLPNKIVALRRVDETDESLTAPLKPLLSGKRSASPLTTTYICEMGACQQPVCGVKGMEEAFS